MRVWHQAGGIAILSSESKAVFATAASTKTACSSSNSQHLRRASCVRINFTRKCCCKIELRKQAGRSAILSTESKAVCARIFSPSASLQTAPILASFDVFPVWESTLLVDALVKSKAKSRPDGARYSRQSRKLCSRAFPQLLPSSKKLQFLTLLACFPCENQFYS